jgi:hypothetical protein
MWPFVAFAAGQALCGAAIWGAFGFPHALGWWGLWLIGAAVFEWSGD